MILTGKPIIIVWTSGAICGSSQSSEGSEFHISSLRGDISPESLVTDGNIGPEVEVG